MRQRRSTEETNISFLDVISCGFGAIVLLLVILQNSLPEVLEEADTVDQGRVKELQKQLFEIRGQVDYLERELNAKQEQLDTQTDRVAVLRSDLQQANSRLEEVRAANAETTEERQELQLALQNLTEEMRRLYENRQVSDNYIGGIPVDSEYVIFVIDTSGSMYNFGWNRLVEEVINILDIYPQVKGLQIMNDMGEYMFSSFRNQWIPDTPSRRDVIISQLRNWHPFSNSSPVEGINAAIRSFYSPDRKISIYVLGDDYTGRSLTTVLDTVRKMNRQNGEPMVRIHAIGFPIQFAGSTSNRSSAVRFAALMRELTHQNMGSFVGLNDFR